MSNSRWQQAHTSSEGCRKNSFLNGTCLWRYLFLGMWHCNSGLCLPPSSCGHFLCVRVLFCPFYIHIHRFRDHSRICLQCRRPGFDPWVGKIPWRRKWKPTPVFLPGEFHGERSLVGYNLWGRKRVRHNRVTNTSLLHTNAVCSLLNL